MDRGRTALKGLRKALKEDLARWSGDVHAATVHERLTARLMRAQRRGGVSEKLQRELEIKKQHATFVYNVASDGAEAAIAQHGLLSKAFHNLQNIAGEAQDLLMGLQELEDLAKLDVGVLKSAYDGGRLDWQRRYVH